MTAIRSLLLLGWAGLALAGCASGPRYHVAARPGTDLAAYSTFTLLPMDEAAPGVDIEAAKRAVPVVLEAVRSELILKGYRETRREEATFAVAVFVSRLPRADGSGFSFAAGGGSGDWCDSYGDFVAEAGSAHDSGQVRLAVQVHDARTKELVWVSYGTGMKRERGSVTDHLERLHAAVARLLDPFPPARAQSAGR